MPFSSRSTIVQPRSRSRRRSVLIWVWIIGFCVAALVATYVMFVEPPPPHRIVIASGSKNGAYHHFAQKYAEELQSGRSRGCSLELYG